MAIRTDCEASGYQETRISRRVFVRSLSLAAIGAITTSHGVLAELGKNRASIQTNPLPKPRVVRVHSSSATNWDYSAEPYLDFIDPVVVDEMVNMGICQLTEENTPADAWKKIMSDYENGDKVAIKPNFNMINRGGRGLLTSPQVISSVIAGLVKSVGVPERNIFIYDLCQVIPKSLMRNRIAYSVNYVQRRTAASLLNKTKVLLGYGLESADTSAQIQMREKIADDDGQPIACYPPKVLTNCQHLINLPILTNHVYLLVSGPLKNHFGTVRFSNNSPYPVCIHGKVLEKSIVDINLSYHIKSKTRLVLCDGLFGMYHRGEMPGKLRWKTFPDEDGTPNSLIFGTDPVAVESIMSDHIHEEREFHGYEVFSHKYLEDAMEKGLGVHDHKDAKGEYAHIDYRQVSM